MGQTAHRNEDNQLIGDTQDIPAGLEWLRFWLEVEHWNFNMGRDQFDGHSEGLCLLAGINPQESKRTRDQYGPEFLPGSAIFYDVSSMCEEDQWYIKEDVDAFIDSLKSLGLVGRVHCHTAISAAVTKGLSPPWLEAANNDFECAKRLPAKLRTNAGIIRRINRGNSSKGGTNRAKKNAKTQVLNGPARQEYEALREKRFPGGWTASSNRPVARSIADQIYDALGQRSDLSYESLPELTTIQKHVGNWLKEKNSSSES